MPHNTKKAKKGDVEANPKVVMDLKREIQNMGHMYICLRQLILYIVL